MTPSPQHILITGCSSGIGFHAAQYLRDKGFSVFPTARKAEDLKALTSLGFDPIALDVSDENSIQQAVQDLLNKTDGKLFGLINNAGFVQAGSLSQLPRKVLESQFATNVFGLHSLTQALMPTFLSQKEGRIIHVSSVLGFVPKSLLGAYNASKYAVEGLGDTLRLELHTHKNLHVVLVQPGPIHSKLFNNAVDVVQHRLNQKQNTEDQSLLDAMQINSKDHPFKKDPVAVSQAFYRALTARHPKTRYRITIPCHGAAWAKRLLPTCIMDWIMRSSDKE